MIHKIINIIIIIKDIEILVSDTTGINRTVLSYETDNIAGGRSFSDTKKQHAVTVQS